MQLTGPSEPGSLTRLVADDLPSDVEGSLRLGIALTLSLIHISEPTRRQKKKKKIKKT
ncbi:hypothetical protein FRIG_15280 [Frigoribacterium faeni]|uniref:hypothetical protein n=1 Tax=Frigoribacterium faeni TaxID=145483 RepID=UPI001FABAEE7|nr:hypothetical protein [Frigoribacterium faeni]MCJ0702478.1 hypothetical protein [Frigoribacterium faeni]